MKGAKPGDLLEIEYLDIRPERYGWTRIALPVQQPSSFKHNHSVSMTS